MRKRVLRAIVPVLLLVGSWTFVGAEQNDEAYRAAVEAFQRGDYQVAADGFQRLVDQSPGWAQGYVALGQCQYMLGNADEGAENILTAIETSGKTDGFAAYYGAAQLLFEAERFDEAAGPLALALDLATDDRAEATSMRLAYALLRADRVDEARATLERHHERWTANDDSRYFLATACQRAGDYACALSNLRASNKPEAWPRLVRWSRYWALQPENQTQRDALIAQALADSTAWKEREPENAEAWHAHAETLIAAGRAADAVELLKPRAEAGEDCGALSMTARAYNATGNGSAAGPWADRAIACDPESVTAHMERATARIYELRSEYTDLEQVRADQKRVRDAIESLERVVALEPNRSSRANAMLDEARITAQRLGQAERDFTQFALARNGAIEERCKVILWTMRDETKPLSAEDEAFNHDHDCKRFAPERASANRGSR